MSLPPVQFEPESAATIDSTETEQDLEYNDTIDYYTAAAGYDDDDYLGNATYTIKLIDVIGEGSYFVQY